MSPVRGSVRFFVESPVTRIRGTAQCLIDDTLGAKKQSKQSDV